MAVTSLSFFYANTEKRGKNRARPKVDPWIQKRDYETVGEREKPGVEKALQSMKNASKAWSMWFFASLFYLYQFTLRGAPNVMADQLIEDFAIHASSFGVLTACYYYCYAALQIPVGLLLDRFGPKAVLRTAVIFCVVGALLFAYAPTLGWASFGRGLIGCGAASGFLGTACISKHWFPPHKLAFVLGLTTAFGNLGGMASNLPLALLLNRMDWRSTMLILVAVGVGVALMLWCLIEKKASQVPDVRPLSWQQAGRSLKKLLKNPSLWGISFYGALMYLPLTVFTDVWGTSFLTHGLGMDRETASIGVSLVLVGCAVGAPLVALLSERLGSRRWPMFCSALLTTLVSAVLVLLPDVSTPLVFALLFGMGVGMTGQTLVFVSASEAMPIHMHGLVSGFINMVVMMGGVIFQPLTGFLIDFFWSGGVDQNLLPLYQPWDYRLALCVLPASACLSLGLSLLITETHPLKGIRKV